MMAPVQMIASKGSGAAVAIAVLILLGVAIYANSQQTAQTKK